MLYSRSRNVVLNSTYATELVISIIVKVALVRCVIMLLQDHMD